MPEQDGAVTSASTQELDTGWELEDQLNEKDAEVQRLQDDLAQARAEIERLEAELARRREQSRQAFDAIDGMHGPKRFTKYPCPCGAMISNAGYAARAHLRGTIHRENMERKALGLEPI